MYESPVSSDPLRYVSVVVFIRTSDPRSSVFDPVVPDDQTSSTTRGKSHVHLLLWQSL